MKSHWVAWLTVILILTMVTPVFTACTDTEKSQNTFVKLLSLFPESAKDFGAICIIDYDRIWDINGISLKTPDYTVPREELYDLVKDTTDGKPFIGGTALGFGSYYTGWTTEALLSPIDSDIIGYDYTCVSAEINNIDLRPYFKAVRPLEKFSDEPDWMIAALGTYDPDKTKAALSNTSLWPVWATQNFNSTTYKGNAIYSWEDEVIAQYQLSYSAPFGTQEGKFYPLSISEGSLLVGPSTKIIKDMIDSKNGKSASLVDVREYEALAKGLYELDVLGAILADESLANGYTEDRQIDSLPRLKHFLTVGTGTGQDENGNYVALVMVHEDSKLAKENASLLIDRIDASWIEFDGTKDGKELSWRDIITDIDVTVNGTVLSAKLYTSNLTLWHDWFYNRWSLLLHE